MTFKAMEAAMNNLSFLDNRIRTIGEGITSILTANNPGLKFCRLHWYREPCEKCNPAPVPICCDEAKTLDNLISWVKNRIDGRYTVVWECPECGERIYDRLEEVPINT
jgi:hypothetical protein